MAEKTTHAAPEKSSAIRTFAQDLAHAKTKHSSSDPVHTTESTKAVIQGTPKVTPPPPPKPLPTPKDIPLPPPLKKPAAHTSPKPAAAAVHKDASATQEKINAVTGELEKRSPKKAPSVLSADSSDVSFDAHDDAKNRRGTVITDTKRKRFTLSAALAASFIAIWEGIKKEYTTSKQPKYTVASAERRKGIIQTATTKTGRDSISDHDRVVSRIRALQSASTPTAHTIESDPEHLLAAPDSSAVPIAPAAPKVVTPPVVATAPPPVITPRTTNPIAEPVEIKSAPIVPVEPQQKSTPITPVVPPQPVPQIQPVVPEVEAAPEQPTPEPAETNLSSSNYSTTWLQKVEAWISPSTLLIIGGTAIMIIVIVVPPLLSTFTSAEQESTSMNTTTNLLGASQMQTVLLSELPATLRASIANQAEGVSSPVEFNIVNDISAEPVHITLLQQLTNELPQSFYDTVTTFRIGVHNQQPFIVIDVTEASVAQGAMYQWEPTMVRELSELLPLPNTLTTATDGMIVGTDMRILQADNNPVVYYGFIKRNMLLITTSEATIQFVLANLNSSN